MGNSTSNAANPHSPATQHNQLHPTRRFDSPTRRTQSPVSRGGSPVPSANRVHKSLRSKKKSLELPDLASLTLTSASPTSSPHPAHRHPRASSPIPIPTPAHPPPQTFRPQNNLPSAARLDRVVDGRSRYKSSLSAFNSTRSFQSAVTDSPPRPDVPLRPEFIPEVIHSTIPLALEPKHEEDGAHKPEHVNTKITWKGGGKKVILIRAGHDNWQGRQPMEFE